MSLVNFRYLRGFPYISNKIEIRPFIEASNEIINVIESFGSLFSPVVSDMRGNISKIISVHQENSSNFYIEDLLSRQRAVDALLWLKRALHLIWAFLNNILNDSYRSETLGHHLQDAYNQTLRPHHDFVRQSIVSLVNRIYDQTPSRSRLIGSGHYHDENIEALHQYLQTMEMNLRRIEHLVGC